MSHGFSKEASRCRLEALLDVRFHHPGVSTTLAREGPCVHRLQDSNFRAISRATAQEVRRIDGFEEACDGQGQERIVYRGHAQGTRRALPCGQRVSSDELGAVPLLLQALDTVVDVRVEGRRVVLGASLLHSGGGLLPDVAPALRQKVLVEPPGEVAEPVALLTCSLLGSALQGGWHGASDPSRSGHVSCAGCVCLSARYLSQRGRPR